MQRLLFISSLRSVKSNALRYGALMLTVALSMLLVIGTLASALDVINSVESSNAAHHQEDGEFGTFVPLTDSEVAKLEDRGLTIEAQPYLDFSQEDGSTLRVMANREQINQVVVHEGALAAFENEIAIETLYAKAKGLAVGDSVQVSGKTCTVSGIVSSPDYDFCVPNLSSTVADAREFGTAFTTADTYNDLRADGQAIRSEAYRYAFLLPSDLTAADVKKQLEEFDVDPAAVDDVYFHELVDRTLQDRTDIEQGIDELAQGSASLSAGTSSLREALDNFDEALSPLSSSSARLAQGLDQLSASSDSLEAGSAEVSRALQQLDAGATQLAQGTSALSQTPGLPSEAVASLEGVARLQSGVETLRQRYQEMDSGLAAYGSGVDAAATGSHQLAQGASQIRGSASDLAHAAADLEEAAGDFDVGVQELKERVNTLLDKQFPLDIDNLTEFTSAADNSRIAASSDDLKININSGLFIGVVALLMIAYVISVFVLHTVDRDSAIIGSLYALGVRRGSLALCYTAPAVLSCFVGGILGTIGGLSAPWMDMMLSDTLAYYSPPPIVYTVDAWVIAYGVVMPTVLAFIVNMIVISRALNRPALSLLRHETHTGRAARITLKDRNFMRTFCVRQLLREWRSASAVIIGLFVCLAILCMGVTCYVLCTSLQTNIAADTKYEYLYEYKYPTEEVPAGGVEAYGESLNRSILGYDLRIEVYGLTDNNPFFPSIKARGQSEVSISSALASKAGLHEGDEVILYDRIGGKAYGFTIAEVVPYSPSLACFMPIDDMRKLFNQEDDYYNIVFADHALDIDAGRLYETVTRADVIERSSIFVDLMGSLIVSLAGSALLILIVVMYQMMAVMIDRSAQSISLMKVFGYRNREIRKLFLDANFIVVAVGTAFVLPLAKWVIDLMYPYFVSNVSCQIDLVWSWQMYVAVYAIVIGCYFVTRILLMSKVSKTSLHEVLQRRE